MATNAKLPTNSESLAVLCCLYSLRVQSPVATRAGRRFSDAGSGSGQIACQSSGRRSALLTRPSSAATTVAHFSTGTRPRAIQLETACGEVPMRSAAVVSPTALIASDNLDMVVYYTPRLDSCQSFSVTNAFTQRVYPCRMVEKSKTITIALELARRRGINKSGFARLLGVSPQDVTNWQSRGMPPIWDRPVADALGCSIDVLHGRELPAADNHRQPEITTGSNAERRLLWCYRNTREQEREVLLLVAEALLMKAPTVRQPHPYKKARKKAEP